jgi:hypothetical protein
MVAKGGSRQPLPFPHFYKYILIERGVYLYLISFKNMAVTNTDDSMGVAEETSNADNSMGVAVETHNAEENDISDLENEID